MVLVVLGDHSYSGAMDRRSLVPRPSSAREERGKVSEHNPGRKCPEGPGMLGISNHMGVDTIYNVGGVDDHCARSARKFFALLLKMS